MYAMGGWYRAATSYGRARASGGGVESWRVWVDGVGCRIAHASAGFRRRLEDNILGSG